MTEAPQARQEERDCIAREILGATEAVAAEEGGEALRLLDDGGPVVAEHGTGERQQVEATRCERVEMVTPQRQARLVVARSRWCGGDVAQRGRP